MAGRRVGSVDPTRILLYPATMPARPVQISLDTDLLGQIEERQQIEARLSRAYSGEAGSLLEEIEELLGAQAWPSD